jgi:hypothetical protein
MSVKATRRIVVTLAAAPIVGLLIAASVGAAAPASADPGGVPAAVAARGHAVHLPHPTVHKPNGHGAKSHAAKRHVAKVHPGNQAPDATPATSAAGQGKSRATQHATERPGKQRGAIHGRKTRTGPIRHHGQLTYSPPSHVDEFVRPPAGQVNTSVPVAQPVQTARGQHGSVPAHRRTPPARTPTDRPGSSTPPRTKAPLAVLMGRDPLMSLGWITLAMAVMLAIGGSGLLMLTRRRAA